MADLFECKLFKTCGGPPENLFAFQDSYYDSFISCSTKCSACYAVSMCIVNSHVPPATLSHLERTVHEKFAISPFFFARTDALFWSYTKPRPDPDSLSITYKAEQTCMTDRWPRNQRESKSSALFYGNFMPTHVERKAYLLSSTSRIRCSKRHECQINWIQNGLNVYSAACSSANTARNLFRKGWNSLSVNAIFRRRNFSTLRLAGARLAYHKVYDLLSRTSTPVTGSSKNHSIQKDIVWLSNQ